MRPHLSLQKVGVLRPFAVVDVLLAKVRGLDESHPQGLCVLKLNLP